jgi:hypothetical protein
MRCFQSASTSSTASSCGRARAYLSGILSAAAQREDLCSTAPDKMKDAILTKVSEKLVKFGFERPGFAKNANRWD